ncbi:MAG TPA: beta-propeller fold lactonase family protein [Candidatus Binatia bacterium]|nr:beta-propeller fold lactonase family protein [Candidatus Binatia bacterium]
MLEKVMALLLAVGAVGVCAGCGTTSSHYLYATVPNQNQVLAYREDPNSGVLTEITGSPYAVGDGANSIVLHPSGNFAYVANPGQQENDISLFDINRNGGYLTEIPPRTTVEPATLPEFLAMDPSGAFLYAADAGTYDISSFSIDSSSGALTPVSGSPFLIGQSPLSIALTPGGNFLYVGIGGVGTRDGFIYGFSVNAGVLTSIGTFDSGGSNPNALAVDPTSSYLYVANSASNSVAIYTISSTGLLGPVSGSPLNDGYTTPNFLILDPAGKFLYVADQGSNNVAAFTITNGLPTALTTSTTSNAYSTEKGPTVLAMDPNGKYLFVGNQGGGAGIQSFSIDTNSSITLTPLFTYGVGNTVSSIAVLQ